MRSLGELCSGVAPTGSARPSPAPLPTGYRRRPCCRFRPEGLLPDKSYEVRVSYPATVSSRALCAGVVKGCVWRRCAARFLVLLGQTATLVVYVLRRTPCQ
jgi:hypothetical protein